MSDVFNAVFLGTMGVADAEAYLGLYEGYTGDLLTYGVPDGDRVRLYQIPTEDEPADRPDFLAGMFASFSV